jgi:hypothetical protein
MTILRNTTDNLNMVARGLKVWYTVGKQTHDLTVTASDSKTTQSGGDNRKKFPLGDDAISLL